MVRPDGSPHVWTDFYLEHYGWIPVDVTYKHSNPNKNYFGTFGGDGIVYTKGLNLPIDRGDNVTYHSGILQLYDWFYFCSKCGKKITAKHKCISEVLDN